MNVINDAKKGAARDAGYNIIKAGEQKAAVEQIDNVNPPYHYDETSNLDLKGTKPTKMTLDINEDMDTQLRAWLDGCGGSGGKDKYENGEAIYFNPETNTKCSDYTEANSKN